MNSPDSNQIHFKMMHVIKRFIAKGEVEKENLETLMSDLPLPEQQFLKFLNLGYSHLLPLVCLMNVFHSFKNEAIRSDLIMRDFRLNVIIETFLFVVGWRGIENILRAYRETSFKPYGPTKTIFDLFEKLSKDWMVDESNGVLLRHASLTKQYKKFLDIKVCNKIFITKEVRPYFLLQIVEIANNDFELYIDFDHPFKSLIGGRYMVYQIIDRGRYGDITFLDSTKHLHKSTDETMYKATEHIENYSVTYAANDTLIEELLIPKNYMEGVVDLGDTLVKPQFSISLETFTLCADGAVHPAN